MLVTGIIRCFGSNVIENSKLMDLFQSLEDRSFHYSLHRFWNYKLPVNSVCYFHFCFFLLAKTENLKKLVCLYLQHMRTQTCQKQMFLSMKAQNQMFVRKRIFSFGIYFLTGKQFVLFFFLKFQSLNTQITLITENYIYRLSQKKKLSASFLSPPQPTNVEWYLSDFCFVSS